jgi:hypothetical protein
MDEAFIKKRIIGLKKEIETCKQELTNICKHEKTSLLLDRRHTYEDYIFICANCGMTFVTEDPNFKYKEG